MLSNFAKVCFQLYCWCCRGNTPNIETVITITYYSSIRRHCPGLGHTLCGYTHSDQNMVALLVSILNMIIYSSDTHLDLGGYLVGWMLQLLNLLRTKSLFAQNKKCFKLDIIICTFWTLYRLKITWEDETWDGVPLHVRMCGRCGVFMIYRL